MISVIIDKEEREKTPYVDKEDVLQKETKQSTRTVIKNTTEETSKHKRLESLVFQEE